MLSLLIYLALLLFSLLYYWHKKRQVDAGFVIIVLYIVYAVFSVLLYRDRVFEFQYFTITLAPLLFLYVSLLLSFSPVFSFNASKYQGIKAPNNKGVIDAIAWIIIFSYIFQIGIITSNLYSGISLILSDEDGAADLYTIMADKASQGGIGISNIFAIVGNIFYSFGILLLFYNLTLEKKKKWIIIGLTIAMLIGILTYIAAGQRGGMVKRTLVAIGTFYLLKNFIDKKTQARIKRIGIIVVAIILFLFVVMSMSRFSNREGGVGSSFNRYAGQSVLYFDQYAFDNNGIRYGDRVVPVFKRLLMFDNVPRNYIERRAKYPHLRINDEVFVTFVGDLCFDFGPIAAFILIVVFSFLIRHSIRYKGAVFPFYKLIPLHWALCLCLEGGSLFPFADLSNLEIIMYMLLYAFFYLDYNDHKNAMLTQN